MNYPSSGVFGNAFFASSANPLKTYLTAGSYFVRLIVANGCGLDTLKQMITVIPPDTVTQVFRFYKAKTGKSSLPQSVKKTIP